jgi:prepilin-type N-terminal cleavage/methylation domain-containing protein
MKRNPQSGVTLIEILIAVSLLSLLSAGVLMAMRIGFNTMEKTDARLLQNRRVANTRKIIESEFAGFFAVQALYRTADNNFAYVPFLQAEPQSMRFVTTYSLEEAWRGRPQIVALQVIPGEQNRGVRLIVNETPYTGPVQAGQLVVAIENDPDTLRPIARFAPITAAPRSFILADRLASCRFSYLTVHPQAPFQRWDPSWIWTERLPLAVRIEMSALDPKPNAVQMISTTLPLNVNRMPVGRYADE